MKKGRTSGQFDEKGKRMDVEPSRQKMSAHGLKCPKQIEPRYILGLSHIIDGNVIFISLPPDWTPCQGGRLLS